MNDQMNFQDVMEMMRSPDGLQQMMLKDSFQTPDGTTFSQAELIADVVNILRMDTKRVAQAVGVDVDIKRMTPERAAELLEGVARGGDMGLIDIFDSIEDKRMLILEELEDEAAVEEWGEQKRSLLYTAPDEPLDMDASTDTEDPTDED